MNNSIEFSIREKKFRFASEWKSVLLTAKAKQVREFKRTVHVQPSVFRINSFSQRILLSWNQALMEHFAPLCYFRRSAVELDTQLFAKFLILKFDTYDTSVYFVRVHFSILCACTFQYTLRQWFTVDNNFIEYIQ